MKQVFKTTLLLAGLTGLFLVVGYALGGQRGMYAALVFSALTNFASYWFSDKIVLKMQRATEVGAGEHPELYGAVQELSTAAGIPMPRVYIVDNPVPNAFATGRSPRHAAVAATTGILGLLTPSELRGVLAHELGHVKNRDILISSVAATAAGAISMLAQMAYFTGGMFGGSDEEGSSNPLGGLAMLIVAPIAASLIQLAVSRSREYHADEFGAHIVGDGDPLANALTKLRDFKESYRIPASPNDEATAHLMFANMFNAGGLVSLFSTHPDINDRIARLGKL